MKKPNQADPNTAPRINSAVLYAAESTRNFIRPPARLGRFIRLWLCFLAAVVTLAGIRADAAALTLNGIGAYSFDGQTVGVEFNGPLDPTSGTSAANYAVAGTTVASVTLQADNQSVVLHLGSTIMGQFVVTVNNVKDSTLANTIAANSQASNTVLNLTLQDFTGGQTGQSQTYAGNVATLVAGGIDIWTGADTFQYEYLTVTNDFDYRLRVISVSDGGGGAFSRSGLMVRDSLTDSGSHEVMAAVNQAGPGGNPNTFQTLYRTTTDSGLTEDNNSATPAAFGSNSWVRMQRQGTVFTTSGSSNGLSWTTLYSFDAATAGDDTFTNSVLFLGIATCAHGDGATILTTAVDSDMSVTPVVPVSITGNLPATAVWRAGAANSLTITAAGNPVFYQWRSNAVDVVGQTNATYTDAITQTGDAGTYSVRVFNSISTNLSGNCVVTVSTDTSKPTIFGAFSYDGLTVGVDYLKAMNPATATNAANYSVTGTTVSSAALSADAQSVFLTLGTPISGQFVVTVNNVQDVSQNVIAANSKATNTVLGLTLADINSISPSPGISEINTGNWATLAVGGADIFGTGDNCSIAYLIATNNFDYQMRVRSIVSPSSQAFARSGLAAREALSDSGSKEFGEYANRANGVTNTFQTLYRAGVGAAIIGVGGNGTPTGVTNKFPDIWVRVRRDGTVFRAYWSAVTPPTTNWVLQTTYDSTNDTDGFLFTLNEDLVTSNEVYLGIQSGAHNANELATITDSDFGVAPEEPVRITTQPAANTVLNEGGNVTLTVAANGIPIYYQWRTNSVAVPGATNAAFAITSASDTSAASVYSVQVYNDISSQISSNATLTVLDDTNTPAITTVSSYDGTTVTVYFSEKLDPTTAANAANYTIAGTTVTGATLLTDGQSVSLTLSTPISGGFTITVNNVKDLVGGNPIVTGSEAFNTTYNTPGLFTLQDYNSGTVPFSATYSAGTLTTVAGGLDTFGGNLNYTLVYVPVAGNFDYRVRAQSVSDGGGGQFTKIGLMARDSNTNGSGTFFMEAYCNGGNGGIGFYQTLRQLTIGAGGTQGGANVTAFGVNSWMRIKRIGNAFTSYYSQDGLNWTLFQGPTTIAMTSTCYLGVMTSAHGAAPIQTTGVSSDFGLTPPESVPAVAFTPRLSGVSDNSGHVVLTWPGTFPGYQLLATPSLTSPVWTTNTAAPAIVSGQFKVTVPASGAAEFFRLTMPQF
jgi:hypothetical protein